MIRISGNAGTHCDGITRRSFVQAGSLGVGGLLLPELLRAREAAAALGAAESKDTAVILLWLSGGPGHMETWDPKPDAPREWRGPFGAIPSVVDGIRFSELMPEQAKIADKVAVVRTVHHGTGDHTKGNHWMLTGFEGPNFNDVELAQRNPAMGSAVAALRGPNRPGIPPYVAVPHLRGGTDNFFHYHAYAGSARNPFVVDGDPNEAKFTVRDLAPPRGLSFDRLRSRKELMARLDGFRAEGDRKLADPRFSDPSIEERDGAYERAFEMLTGPAARTAFDISAEPTALREKYGLHTFGQSALLARRLVEAGVTFVTVNCVPWDHHGTAPQLKTEEGGKLLIPPLDRALSALIRDLHDRGLARKVLVLAMGEFGRTPRINRDAGRDHWGHTFSVLFAGGDVKTGQVVGQSDGKGEYPVDKAFTPQDVLATVYRHLGIDPHIAQFVNRFGRPVYLLEGGAPIRELVG